MNFKRKPLSHAFSKSVLFTGLLGASLLSYADYLSDAQSYFSQKKYQPAVIQLKNALQEDAKNAEARLLLGQVYLAKGDFADAEKELRIAQSLGIASERVALAMGKALLSQGKVDDGLTAMEGKTFADAQETSEALAILGHLYMAKNRLEDARLSFKRSLELGQQTFAILGQARLALLEGKDAEGLSKIEEALAQDPQFVEALFVKGQVLAKQEKHAEAIAVYDELLAVDAGHMSTRIARAESYVRVNDLEKAKADAMSVLKQNEMQPHANFLMARLQLEAKEYEQAQTSAEKVLRMIPDHQLSFFVLGAAHYAQDNFEQAKIYLEKFVTQQPKHSTAARVLGATYVKLGDPASAIEMLEPFSQSAELQDAQLLNILGRAYLNTGKFDQGTQVLSRAISIDPSVQGVQAQIALAHLAAGRTEEAIGQLEEINASDAADDMTSIMLVLSYVKQNRFAQALQLIDDKLKANPNNGGYLNLLGMVHEAKGDMSTARAAYGRALNADKEFIPALLSLAKMDFREGNIAAAKEGYQRVLKVSPNHLQSMLAMAQFAQSEGNEKALFDWLTKARNANPNALMPVEILMNYHLLKNEPDKAFNEVRRYQSEHEDNVQVSSLFARVHLAKGEKDQAKYHLQRVIEANKNDIAHRMQLAQLHASEKQYQKGLVLVEEVLSIEARYLPALVAKAQIQIEEQDFGAAEQSIAAVSQHFGNEAIDEQLLGDLAGAQGDKAKALEQYEAAFAQTKTPYLVNKLFDHYAASQDWQAVADRLALYLEAAPRDANNKLRLASVYQRLAQNQKAMALYEQVLELAPENGIILNNLAWLYWQIQDARSLDYARRAHQAEPDRAEIIDTLGWIMLHMGDKNEALDLIRQAATKAPTNPEIRYHLAVALNQNGQKEQAKKELTRLLRDYSGFSEEEAAKELLSQL